MRPLRLGMQLGLFQLSLVILGVLIVGLLNRLLIQDIQLPALLAALAVGGQQLMGFTRAWFGHRSDRIPPSRLRRRRLWHECLCHHIAECVDRPGLLWWPGAQWLLVD